MIIIVIIMIRYTFPEWVLWKSMTRIPTTANNAPPAISANKLAGKTGECLLPK